jgi:hypothetical protein
MKLADANRLLDPGYTALESGLVVRVAANDRAVHVVASTRSRVVRMGRRARHGLRQRDAEPLLARRRGPAGGMAPDRETRIQTFPDTAAEGLLKHCHEEMTYLAGFLPALYVRETAAD